MSHQIYENFVLENKIEDMLITSVDMNNYITADYSLTEKEGMKKVINVYSATGDVEELAMGEGNETSIEVAFTPVEYEVGVTQGRFAYYDEQAMTDEMVVETGLKKMSADMVNDLTKKAVAEWDKATLIIEDATWTFENVVDAIALMDVEDESGLFLMIAPAQQATFRKNLKADLSYVEGFVRSGYIGHVCGVPVIVSKAVGDGKAYLASKDAVTCFIKKGSEIEQERDANTRTNTVYARKVMLVALTNADKVVKLTATVNSGEVVEPETPDTPETDG